MPPYKKGKKFLIHRDFGSRFHLFSTVQTKRDESILKKIKEAKCSKLAGVVAPTLAYSTLLQQIVMISRF